MQTKLIQTYKGYDIEKTTAEGYVRYTAFGVNGVFKSMKAIKLFINSFWIEGMDNFVKTLTK